MIDYQSFGNILLVCYESLLYTKYSLP